MRQGLQIARVSVSAASEGVLAVTPCKLVRISSGAGQQEILLADVTSIGRQPTNTMQIVDRLVSKEHAIISRTLGTASFFLADLDSRNGTYLNDRLVEGKTSLKHGDTLRIGSTMWRYVAPEGADYEDPDTIQSVSTEGTTSASIHATMQIDLAHDFVAADLVLDERMLRADYEKLRLAYELSSALAEAHDIDMVLDRLLERVFNWLPVDRGVVLFVDEKKAGNPADHLIQMAVRIRPGAAIGEVEDIRVPRSILDQTLRKREAVLSTDARLDARFGQAQSVVLQGIRSSMTVPLVTKERMIGILHVDSLISSGLFGEKDLAVLASVSRQASISIDNVLLQKRIVEEATVRSNLSRMLSPNLVDRIVSGALAIEKGGALRRVTVMFADIRGFTSLTERTPPTEMVAFMNDYFERVSNVIFKYEGTLDKYIGDAVMALWGAPLGTDDDDILAVRAAYEMQLAVTEFNIERAANGEEAIGVGIGIATAQVIAGYVGSSRTMSYTVFGRGVNLASRLCSAAKSGEVLISPTTWLAVRHQVQAEQLAELKLKGMADPVAPLRLLRMN
ncbi:MAG: FHA domain-containing protein [Myxococcales bacterium]|nr:FHA domain-containing protein [Myxococcales bacterium]